MALFDGDLISVTTPDGRQITVPQQLAAQFPGLKPAVPPEVAQPPALPVAPPPPVFSTQDQADIAQRTAPPPDTAAAAPVTSPSQVEPSGPQAPRGPVASPAQATDAGPANTPAPVTNDQLAKMGVAGGLNAELAANDAQRAAVKQQGAALANQADKVGAAMAASEAEAGRLLEQRRMAAEENARMMQSRTDEYLRNAKAVADTKIDRSVDHPVLAAIGVALGAVGGAMMQKQYGGQLTNPGLDALYKAIDRKAAAQVQDLELKRQGLATQRDALGLQRQSGLDRLQEMDTYRLGYIEQAKRQVETIKQQTTSDVVRATADVTLAGLNQEAAKTISGAQARWQTQHDAELARKQTMQIAQMSNATTRRGQDMQQREADLNRAERAQEKIDAIAAQLLTSKGAAGEKAAKDLRERGLYDPSTGDVMINPDGQKKLKDADDLEALARKNSDPTQAAAQRTRAVALRESAKMNDAELAPDAESARKAREATSATHAMYQKLADVKEMLSADPSAWDRERWASIKTELGAIANEYASTIGERVSPKAMDAFVEHIAGFDADNLTSRVASKGKAIAAVDQLEKFVKTNSDARLKSLGIKSGWTPSAPNESSAERTFKGKTAQEIGEDQLPAASGAAASAPQVQAARSLVASFGAPRENEPPQVTAARSLIRRAESPTGEGTEAQRSAENAAIGDVRDYGLDPKDAKSAREIIAQADTAGDAKRAQLVESLAQPIIKGRPGFVGGISGVLRDMNPPLYAEVIQRVAAENPALAQQIIEAEQARSSLPGLSVARSRSTEAPVGLPWKEAR